MCPPMLFANAPSNLVGLGIAADRSNALAIHGGWLGYRGSWNQD
jgi:hypothetical protein